MARLGQRRIGARVMRLDVVYLEWSGKYPHSKWVGARSASRSKMMGACPWTSSRRVGGPTRSGLIIEMLEFRTWEGEWVDLKRKGFFEPVLNRPERKARGWRQGRQNEHVTCVALSSHNPILGLRPCAVPALVPRFSPELSHFSSVLNRAVQFSTHSDSKGASRIISPIGKECCSGCRFYLVTGKCAELAAPSSHCTSSSCPARRIEVHSDIMMG